MASRHILGRASKYSKEYVYDAFVCYNQEDPEEKLFVKELTEELEGRRGLRLYVPGRDDVSAASDDINNADQIEKRCQRMIIVISRSFLQSPFNDFQERYAQGVSRERLIPIIREEGAVVPRIYQGRNTYDLTNTDVEETWVRLATALRESIDEDDNIYAYPILEDLREQRFPSPSDANDQTRPKEVNPSRTVQSQGLREPSDQFTSETSQNIRTDLQLLQKKRKNINEVHITHNT